jgi:hypothetical protein
MTKTEARKWLKRIRENARLIEESLRANDWDEVASLADDIGGAASEISSGVVHED